MPATATKPKKIKSPAERLRTLAADIRAESAAEWRRWAIALADGQSAPDGRELLAAAAALAIPDAAAALQADADAINQARAALRSAAACVEAAAELLAPFGGNPVGILRAIDHANAEVERLTLLYAHVADECGAAGHRSTLHHLRCRHKLVWASYHDDIPAAKELT